MCVRACVGAWVRAWVCAVWVRCAGLASTEMGDALPVLDLGAAYALESITGALSHNCALLRHVATGSAAQT